MLRRIEADTLVRVVCWLLCRTAAEQCNAAGVQIFFAAIFKNNQFQKRFTRYLCGYALWFNRKYQ